MRTKTETSMNIKKLNERFSQFRQRGLLSPEWNCNNGFNNFLKWCEINNWTPNLEIHRIRIGEIKKKNRIFPKYSNIYGPQSCILINKTEHIMIHIFDKSGFVILDIYQIKIDLRDKIMTIKEIAKKFNSYPSLLYKIKNQKSYANIKL